MTGPTGRARADEKVRSLRCGFFPNGEFRPGDDVEEEGQFPGCEALRLRGVRRHDHPGEGPAAEGDAHRRIERQRGEGGKPCGQGERDQPAEGQGKIFHGRILT